MERNGAVYIETVAHGKGAADAGLKAGNRLLKVGGHSATSSPVVSGSAQANQSLDRVTRLLMGEQGSCVDVEVQFYSTSQRRQVQRIVSVTRK
jgi:hypothetical protein